MAILHAGRQRYVALHGPPLARPTPQGPCLAGSDRPLQGDLPARAGRAHLGGGMSRRPARVTQADVARAIRAADQCGSGRVVEIMPDGIIRIVPAELGRPLDVTPKLEAAGWPALDDGKPIDF